MQFLNVCRIKISFQSNIVFLSNTRIHITKVPSFVFTDSKCILVCIFSIRVSFRLVFILSTAFFSPFSHFNVRSTIALLCLIFSLQSSFDILDRWKYPIRHPVHREWCWLSFSTWLRCKTPFERSSQPPIRWRPSVNRTDIIPPTQNQIFTPPRLMHSNCNFSFAFVMARGTLSPFFLNYRWRLLLLTLANLHSIVSFITC